MADGRGGYQKPSKPQPASGPGRYSKRTDANDPPATPGLKDSDLRHGDVQKLEQGQKIAPLAKSPSVAPPTSPSPSRGAGGAGIPPSVFNSESTRGEEPVTAGLDVGGGPGSEALMAQPEQDDPRQAVLQFLAARGNPVAQATLMDSRAGISGQPPTPPSGRDLPTSATGPENPTMEEMAFDAPQPTEDIETDVMDEEVL